MQIPRALIAIAAAALLPGCVGFQQQWLAAQKTFPPPHKNIQGPWIGSWTSGHNGHSGKLRCIITESAPGSYRFYYWATWARVISGGFEIECELEEKDGRYQFDGTMDLGKLGGEFDHKGSATANELKATWQSKRGDHGTFELKRPE